MTRQMQIGHRKRFLELQVRDGVEDLAPAEHLIRINLSSLNSIEEALLKGMSLLADSMAGNNVKFIDYKL